MGQIARHYGISGLLDRTLQALRAQGRDLERLTPADIAPADEFHIRGRQATVELSELADAHAGWRVLDVGSGLGGSTRFLAAEFGCDVTGVDLTEEFCVVATALSKLVALDGLTKFCCATSLEMPFSDAKFNLAWTQHGQMNIANKRDFYQEIRRVLQSGGRFVFHDILAGPSGTPHLPVHWAEEPTMSFLIAPDDLRQLLEHTGFKVLAWRDTTDVTREWYLAALK